MRQITTLILIILITPVFSQSIAEKVKIVLGVDIDKAKGVTVIDNKNASFKTDYGNFVFKYELEKDRIFKMKIIIDNRDNFYTEITDELKNISIVKIGTIWTDFIIDYIPIETKYFKKYQDALDYYNEITSKDLNVYKGASIYKSPEKERYVVGIFYEVTNEYNEKMVLDDQGLMNMSIGRVSNKKVVHEWTKLK